MAISRRNIVFNGSFVHCTFRCLNREFLFEDDRIKAFIVKCWARFKDRYGISIYDYCVLSNHAHMIIKAPSAKVLGDFMRVCNSRIALYVNKLLGRDSHALKERYKSPVIVDSTYFVNCLAYVWLNYYKATGVKPLEYKYGSAFYRGKGLPNEVLSPYTELPIDIGRSEMSFVIDLLNGAMSKHNLEKLTPEVFEHSHTIGSAFHVDERSRLIAELRKINSA